MIHEPRVLMIGAQEKDAGKTRLSERIIGLLTAQGQSLAAVKVTVIRERQTEWGFRVWEEQDSDRDKDTGRLLRAGAHPVLWLKCDDDHLSQGIKAILDRLPSGAVLMESNSARRVLRPGLFLMVHRRKGSLEIKASASSVLPDVNRFILSNLNAGEVVYDPDPLDHLACDGDGWHWR